MRRFWIAPLLSALVAGAAAAAPRTVSDYGNAMDDIAERLDIQLAGRQNAGEAAAAQRLALAAAMIRRASAEFHTAEQDALTDAADTLPAPIKAKLDAAYAMAESAETRAAVEPRFIDEAHVAFNALIDMLPIHTPHPTFYGLLSNDLTEPSAQLPADVVVYGDRLIDPVYGVAPTAAYLGSELPSDALHVNGDRLEITLPAQIKAAVHFAPPPCERRPSFGLRLHGLYGKKHRFWPFVWHTPVDTSADLFALASPVFYEAHVSGQVETSGATASTVKFRRRSTFVVADCEQTKAADVAIATPAGVSDLVCEANWVDAVGRTQTSGVCDRKEGTLGASGTLTGLAKVCSPDKLCSCPSNASGYLEISGSYQLSQATRGFKALPEGAPLAFPLGDHASTTFGDEHVRLLKIDVSRRQCPVVAETLTIGLGEDAGATGAAKSKSGEFRASFENGRLSVGSASAFPP